ncbi:MAG: GatB/YqeY domain-containing protein [Candidatus Woesebacteria bacterium GW2011_GWA1_37_8]|uniref:GatB/YqeY domain-containing protein n=2 Tax=Candidatus Woeseibacteriota TaxID=1752722 RepID=A0A0G0L5A4_9BACT|nr:MAG: GatB/YqeY domain-containing protein [Microgenomates group bacterium GW2011_GWC1_37_12b]KKQ43776.1 MAG: GatB/YqeY domain-containing protein [Candidatus Woesebacteria bacterium GW2011_GWA1_37_8]KKQ87158.1 MAG: GatB/YqeY domain-containing protein [Candidatus Woesebacteria bacterium GW2011_GWB1_38_8b]
MIADTITAKIGDALKAKDELRLSVLRMLSSALNYEKIAKQHDLNEQEEIAVVRREAKKRNDSIDSLKNALGKQTSAGGDSEINVRIEKDQKEIDILKEYLPAEMDETELQKLVDDAISETGATSISDMGRVIGIVMGKAAGRVEGGKVSQAVKNKLV